MSERVCPIPDCGAELYLTTSYATPIDGETTKAHLRNVHYAVTVRWTVDCTNGHTLLDPATDTDCAWFGETWGADDDVPIDDMARLDALCSLTPAVSS